MPAGSLLPAVGGWLSAAVRGLLAMAPPPPPRSDPAVPPFPCPGVPQSLFTGAPVPLPTQMLWCGPCQYDSTRLCSYTDEDGDGNPDSDVLPVNFRGFDDPQADPTPGLLLVPGTVYVQYVRADMYSLPPIYTADDTLTGNPPWGSKVGDGDADAKPDALPDRHNQGAFAAGILSDRPSQRDQQFPQDAFAGVSCPFPPIANPCDPHTTDCGGIAKYDDGALNVAKPSGYTPYPVSIAPSPADWPVIPFPRDWGAYKGSDADSIPAIKRLLRFTSSIVSYDKTKPHMNEYSLAEDARNVIATAPGTPLAGALWDAYNYFNNSVFPQTDDPAINCRSYIIVLMTDGLDECFSDPCLGDATHPLGVSGDLGSILLPSNPMASPPLIPQSARELAHAADPSVRVNGIPVFVVAMNADPSALGVRLQCIADNSGGHLYAANDRAGIVNALQSILEFKRNAQTIAAPALPAFAGGTGDSAQIGAVIPSHTNVDGSASQWAIWTGSLKSFALDLNGNIPVVTGVPATPTPTFTPGGPTPVPVVATPTPVGSYPDESDPNNALSTSRKPVWNAGRVLGYTNPNGVLTNAAAAAAAAPAGNAPVITVWPGRKMVWADPGAGGIVPIPRQEFAPNAGLCTGGAAPGTCFGDLMASMNLAAPQLSTATATVQFLRGGISNFGSRDEVLQLAAFKPAGALVGPGAGQQQRFSYFFQDDIPTPGAPQVQTDGASSPAGYSHKLGDIFHAEPFLLDVPRYFQYLSADLTPRVGQSYSAFSALLSKRRRVVFAGSNDGFLHAFDAGVYNRDVVNFANTFDLGTGREIFAYIPRALMAKAPSLLSFPPRPNYFVDGSVAVADVFMDPGPSASPSVLNRVWKSVLVGTLRQGGHWVYGLDVTQPDRITAAGDKIAPADTAPDCLDGGGTCPNKYPTVLWELTDDCTVSPSNCLGLPTMGETWSKPVVGRVKLVNGGSYEDHYVAIFGGGFDPLYNPLDPINLVDPNSTQGRALYLVDVETGKVIYKATQGMDSSAGLTDFAPMPGNPAAADFNDDGYLDIVYIGDVNGRLWRLDLTADVTSSPKKGELVSGLIQGWQPFLLYDASTGGTLQPNQPIFMEPALIYLSGGVRPTLGIGFGTGNRADLLRIPNPSINRFFYVIDDGGTTTLHETDLQDITPPVAPCTPPCATKLGFFLPFSTPNEKATSTVSSTNGFLTLVTFTPESNNPCGTEGSSFQYRFFFLSGAGGYNIGSPTGTYADYVQTLGAGLAAAAQSTSPTGDTIDTILYSGGAINQVNTPGSQRTINQNWKEQNQ